MEFEHTRMKFGWSIFLLTAACFVSHAQTVHTFVVRMPKFVAKQVEPKFTSEALKAGQVGNGAIDVWVDENGAPVKVKLVSWTNVNSYRGGRLGLDKAAITAIKQWRFVPLIVAGKPTPFQIRIGALLHPAGSTFTNSFPEASMGNP
jgi:TonB family protein